MNEDVIIHAHLFIASSSGLYLAESFRLKSQPVLNFYRYCILFTVCVRSLVRSILSAQVIIWGHIFLINLLQFSILDSPVSFKLTQLQMALSC